MTSFSSRLRDVIGRAVAKDHFLARLGGDEFAIIVPECGDPSKLERLASKVIDAVSGSVALERGDVAIETSIGIVLFPRDGTTANDVLRNADLALYRAKEEGRGRFEFFRPEMIRRRAAQDRTCARAA